MIKKISFILGIILGFILLDSIQAIVFNNSPIIKIRENRNSTSYIDKGLFVTHYYCSKNNEKTVSKTTLYACPKKERKTELNDKIIEYLENSSNDISNFSYNYVDEEKGKIIVGLIENTPQKQEEFISKIFPDIQDRTYIKDNSLIEFQEDRKVVEATIIEVEEETITVETLKDNLRFKKGDKIIMTKISNENENIYKIGNNIRITFYGIILTSNPCRISPLEIELL